MRMRYVSNAGIILETEETSIGIDCFCKDENHMYQDLEPAMKEELFDEIEKGKIKQLVFTHGHSDHFCAQDVAEACKRNSQLEILAGKQVITELKKQGVSEKQMTEIALIEEQVLKKQICRDLHIRFLETLHDGEQYMDVQNLTLLINIGSKTLVITGDAQPRQELFREIQKWSAQIDWLLAPFPYVGLHTARKAISENLSVKQILVLHQPKEEADAQKWVVNTKNVCKQAQDDLPYPVFPERTDKWYEI